VQPLVAHRCLDDSSEVRSRYELHDLQLVLFVGVLNALLLSLLLLRDRISPVIGSFVIFDHLMKSLGLLVKSRLLLT